MNPSKPAALALAAVNSLILIGPLLLDWNLHALFTLYWIELVVIGMFNIVKMLKAVQLGELGKSRSYQVIFFIAHYATFCVLYRGAMQLTMGGPESLSAAALLGLAIGVAFLTLSHGLSFTINYIGLKEFARTSSLKQMWAPYRRVLPVQAIIVPGVLVIARWDGGHLALIALVAAKTIADIWAHLREHSPSAQA